MYVCTYLAEGSLSLQGIMLGLTKLVGQELYTRQVSPFTWSVWTLTGLEIDRIFYWNLNSL